jgi:hypothetical protein
MISVVCVYNNKGILRGSLLKSLGNCTSQHELILIDNTQRRFKSAAEALNWGGRRANGDYIMFVHQDVDLCSNSWLEDAERILDSILDLGIAGVAGMSNQGRKNEERGRNIIEHGDDRRLWEWGNPIQKPERVQTLDECLIIIPKSVFDLVQFDEETCNNWDLYGVDYCLSCNKKGFHAYVIPLSIYHKSAGRFAPSKIEVLRSVGTYRKSYYQTLEKLTKKHKNYYKHIYTTCGDWNTSYPVIVQRFWVLMKGSLERLRLGKFPKMK